MSENRNIAGQVRGRVQRVGFRYFVLREAQAEALTGYVRNLPDGRVEFQLYGETAAVDRVLARIRQGPKFARVDDMQLHQPAGLPAAAEFVIR